MSTDSQPANMTINDLLESAVACHRRGQFSAAEKLYRQVLTTDPCQFDALHLLGIILHQTGDSAAAIEMLHQALAIKPASAEAHFNLGNVLHQIGDAAGAADCYRRAIERRADYGEAHYNLGNVLRDQGDVQGAAASFERAVALRPDDANAYFNLGRIRIRLHDYEAAVAPYEHAVRLRPMDAKTQLGLADALRLAGRATESIAQCRNALAIDPGDDDTNVCLGAALLDAEQYEEALAAFDRAILSRGGDPGVQGNRGVALLKLGRPQEAIACFERALALQPDHAEVLINLGVALLELEQPEEALAALDRAGQALPDHAAVRANRAAALLKLGRLEESIACCRATLERDPNNAEAFNNLGINFLHLGKYEEALAALDRSLQCRPDYAEAHAHRACIWLSQGDDVRGWPEYEWRWKCKGRAARDFRQPQWDGSPLAGRTILLHAEQGLGDTIQFIRLVPVVRARGGRVLVECQDRLAPLFARAQGVDQVISRGQPLPEFDVHAALLSLPGMLGIKLDQPPAAVPYLSADEKLVESWRARFAAQFDPAAFRIGIHWTTTGQNQQNPYQCRSIDLASFAPLASERAELIALESENVHAAIEQVVDRFSVAFLGDDVDQAAGPFMDTAAIIKNLDLVITSDTSIAHLAGALGVPVWVAIPVSCDWRWGIDREETPWYPTMRLFRQREPGNWQHPFAAMAERLEEILDNRGTAGNRPGGFPPVPSVKVPIAPAELIDKLTILEIKLSRISDFDKLAHVQSEYDVLRAARDAHIPPRPELTELEGELKKINDKLWRIEDYLRRHERQRKFDADFIKLARLVYITNDKRAALKRQINELLGSAIIEQKDYSR